MPKPPAKTPGAQARSISLDLILPRTFAPTQDLESQQPPSASGFPERSPQQLKLSQEPRPVATVPILREYQLQVIRQMALEFGFEGGEANG